MTKRISSALAIAAFMLGAAIAIRYGQRLQFISADAARRAIQVVMGLVLALFGNFIPKDNNRSPMSACESPLQSPLRVGGWAFTLAGLAYAALWAFAPITFADVVAITVVAAATLITAGYSGWVILSHRQGPNRPSI